MKNSTKEDRDYCKNLIRMSVNARHLQLAFLPEDIKSKAEAYYALDAELKHVHLHVSEEMIGHIRFAWWREAMDKIKSGVKMEHPVMRMLADSGIETEKLIALVDSYREAYPQMPEHPPELLVDHAKWNKAGRIIANHKGSHLGLIFRLLFI
jgi:phytoene synthase